MHNKIRFYRIEKGYTLNCLAKLSGISVGYLCHLEKGSRNNPSYNVMNQISLALEEDMHKVFSK